ncbi:MAG: bifunctional alpha,alpha-trehalose-phosphate synthase (UDP-forming)/trehalose-phosphatase [Cytophagales bacterium]|nr:bifunctional alpha,alpha-trehalose-phosphate synthase (UDP-forming)/trehalose-phosphatase [Cytophaga sp.]
MKIINISNRLPISLQQDNNQTTIKTSSGGLVSAVMSLGSGDNELHWIGVADFTSEDWDANSSSVTNEFILHPVFIDEELYKLYYNGFSNSVLWPLFHYFPSFVEYKKNEFDAYLEVNRLIADKVIDLINAEDIVWIHDYHLIPLVAYLRKLIPQVKIGFFLHVPFPSYELIRILPKDCRDTLANSLLGADLIGFHTYDYVQHFVTTVQMITGIQHKNFQLQYEGRTIKIEAFPISIDFKKFNNAYSKPEVAAERIKIRKLYAGKKILFSVDRLDYTKGIKYRLQGYAYFLENNPEWIEKIVFILIAVPSRDNISKYEERKEIIEKLIGQINGKYGNYKWSPIVYQYGSVDADQLSGLYTSCDVALISPVRDGMNLVAKEFLASRYDKRGVLLLSDMTGAAKELTEALLFNPLDEAEISHKIKRALAMPDSEQETRMERMQNQIRKNDVFKWSNNFIKKMENITHNQNTSVHFESMDRLAVLETYLQAKTCLILLDYDGTLKPLQPHPDKATPDDLLYQLLTKLTHNTKNEVCIISGRNKETLENWFGELKGTLVAEHGIFVKKDTWQNLVTDSAPWKADVKKIMDQFTENCANTFVEEKSASLCWHYRMADPEASIAQSRELMNLLSDFLISSNANILDGHKVVEVKPVQAGKGNALKTLFDFNQYDCCICIGDDKTDEDMFEVVNAAGGITFKVGEGHTIAHHRFNDVQEVLSFLAHLN